MDAFTSSGNYVGTDRLNRPLTDAENKRLGKLLREHDFAGASMVALRFAYKLTRSRERARDLMGRTNLRLVRWGWDPNAVSLVKCLCRLVWSEFTHAKSEAQAARRAEEMFLREQEVQQGALRHSAPTRGEPEHGAKEPVAPSPEQQIIGLEEEREDEATLAAMRANFARLHELFGEKKDEVSLLYLDRRLKGADDVATMAKESGRDVQEFYAAARRLRRAVEKILAENDGAPPDDEENE